MSSGNAPARILHIVSITSWSRPCLLGRNGEVELPAKRRGVGVLAPLQAMRMGSKGDGVDDTDHGYVGSSHWCFPAFGLGKV